jgi:predicted transglutaminase-like cysteine proteinase
MRSLLMARLQRIGLSVAGLMVLGHTACAAPADGAWSASADARAPGAMTLGARAPAPMGYLNFCARRPDQCGLDATQGDPEQRAKDLYARYFWAVAFGNGDSDDVSPAPRSGGDADDRQGYDAPASTQRLDPRIAYSDPAYARAYYMHANRAPAAEAQADNDARNADDDRPAYAGQASPQATDARLAAWDPAYARELAIHGARAAQAQADQPAYAAKPVATQVAASTPAPPSVETTSISLPTIMLTLEGLTPFESTGLVAALGADGMDGASADPLHLMDGGWQPAAPVQIASPTPAPSSQPAPLAATPALMAELDQVNLGVNRAIRYVPDEQLYGRADYWALPLEPGGPRAGDCKDYVLEKRRALITDGVPSTALSIAIVQTGRDETHAVLIVSTDKGELVLDSLSSWVRPWRDSHYSWVERQAPGQQLVWVKLPANGVG